MGVSDGSISVDGIGMAVVNGRVTITVAASARPGLGVVVGSGTAVQPTAHTIIKPIAAKSSLTMMIPPPAITKERKQFPHA